MTRRRSDNFTVAAPPPGSQFWADRIREVQQGTDWCVGYDPTGAWGAVEELEERSWDYSITTRRRIRMTVRIELRGSTGDRPVTDSAARWYFEAAPSDAIEKFKGYLALAAVALGCPTGPGAYAHWLNFLRTTSADGVHIWTVTENDSQSPSLDRLEVEGAVTTRFDAKDPRVAGFMGTRQYAEIQRVRETTTCLFEILKTEAEAVEFADARLDSMTPLPDAKDETPERDHTLAEACELLRIKRVTLWRWKKANKILIRGTDKHQTVPRSEVDRINSTR